MRSGEHVARDEERGRTAPADAVQRRPVDIPPSGLRRVRTLVGRALRLCCPLCGGRAIWRSWFTIKDDCPHCGTRFLREHGYFLGAMAVNLVAAEFIAVAAIVALFAFTDLSWIWMEAIVLPIALGLPLLFWPFARTLWIAVDLMFTPDRPNQRRVGG